MLQRAASHAYSWWWASHIRTKQSKWLEQSLQDMEEKVQGMLLLIEGDGDSFAKRAEMYYRRRPELICAVEESYKVFRSLADRYDLLSKDLQNANHTIATVFPEQVQFPMSDDDEIPKIPENLQIPEMNLAKAPEVPKAPTKHLNVIMTKASKQFQAKALKAFSRQKSIVRSGLSKEEADEEVNKLQKEILALQTMKEFVKSSYESGIAKYWGIESQVMDMQQRISRLQDEFSMDSVIEDEEARTLMAEAALKSCQETLATLQEKQDKTTKEARDEYERIEAACERLQSLREKYVKETGGVIDGREGCEPDKFSTDVADLIRETKEIEELPERVEENLDLDVNLLASLSVSQLAEKIDLLVNKVFTLETAVSSQTVLVNTLRSETDDLNSQIRYLEEGKEISCDDSQGLSTRVRSMEEKLNKVQDLTKNVEMKNNSLETNFARTRTSLYHLAEKLTSVKEDDEVEEAPDHDQPSEDAKSDHLSEAVKGDAEVEGFTNLDRVSEKSVKADEETEASANLDHDSRKLSSEKPDEEMDASAKLDHASRELSSEKPDEEVESNANLDHASAELSRGKPAGEVEAHQNLDHDSRKLSGEKPDEEVEASANLDHDSRKQSSGKPEEEEEAHENLDYDSRKINSLNGDEYLDAYENLDHSSRKLTSSVNAEEELEADTNLDHSSRNLNNTSINAEEERVGYADLDHSSREVSSAKPDEASSSLDQQGKEVAEDVIVVDNIRLSVSSIPEQEDDEKVIRKARNRITVVEFLSDEPDDTNTPPTKTKTKTKSKAEADEDEEDEDDISWQQILLSGMEDREKILLKEYTTILRNYKDVKKKLNDIEKKERDIQFDTTIQMRELKKAISKRDEEIMRLRRMLNIDTNQDDFQLPTTSEDQTFESETNVVLDVTRDIKGPPLVDENSDNRVIFISKSPSISRAEEKLRTEIDAILDENLDFWFRFSTSFHQIQKFKTEARDLEEEITKLRDKHKPDKSEVMPIYKHLTEIQRELTMWLDRSVPLKDELKNRFASLCIIQEEITKALKEGVEAEEIKFSSHQAAKLQGEVLNMKQENDKVREELEAGLDHVRMLQLQIEKTLGQVNEEFDISQNRHKLPLRSFIFGSKTKKPKSTSLFSLMHPNRKYQMFRGGMRQSSSSNTSTS